MSLPSSNSLTTTSHYYPNLNIFNLLVPTKNDSNPFISIPPTITVSKKATKSPNPPPITTTKSCETLVNTSSART